jgi:hypothetical protein
MEDPIVFVQGSHQSVGIAKGWSMGTALLQPDVD